MAALEAFLHPDDDGLPVLVKAALALGSGLPFHGERGDLTPTASRTVRLDGVRAAA